MVMMQRAQKPSDSKIVKLAMTEESLETELVYWIRDLIRSYSKLIPALDVFDVRTGSSETVSR
jgi:hypothetical protein